MFGWTGSPGMSHRRKRRDWKPDSAMHEDPVTLQFLMGTWLSPALGVAEWPTAGPSLSVIIANLFAVVCAASAATRRRVGVNCVCALRTVLVASRPTARRLSASQPGQLARGPKRGGCYLTEAITTSVADLLVAVRQRDWHSPIRIRRRGGCAAHDLRRSDRVAATTVGPVGLEPTTRGLKVRCSTD